MSSTLGGGAFGSVFAINGLSAPQQTISILVDGLEKVTSVGSSHVAAFSVAGGGNPIAANVVVTPAGQLVATNAQTALQEIDQEINAMTDLSVWFANQLL